QEVAVSVLLAILPHHDAEVERVSEELLVVRAGVRVQILEYGAGAPPVELVDHVALAARDEHGLTDRPAALRDDGVDGDVARERAADRATPVHDVVEIEHVGTR